MSRCILTLAFILPVRIHPFRAVGSHSQMRRDWHTQSRCQVAYRLWRHTQHDVSSLWAVAAFPHGGCIVELHLPRPRPARGRRDEPRAPAGVMRALQAAVRRRAVTGGLAAAEWIVSPPRSLNTGMFAVHTGLDSDSVGSGFE